MSSLPSNIEAALQKQLKDHQALEQSNKDLTQEIASKTAKAGYWQDRIAKFEVSLKGKQAVAELKLKEYQQKLGKLDASWEGEQAKLVIIRSNVVVANSELTATNKTIDERSVYLAQQETQIEKATDSWRDSLREMQAQYNELEARKTQLLRDTFKLTDTKNDLEQQLQDLSDKASGLLIQLAKDQKSYETKREGYIGALGLLKKEALEITTALEQREQEVQHASDLLEYRERSLEIQAETLEKAEIELEMKERQIASKLAIRASGRL